MQVEQLLKVHQNPNRKKGRTQWCLRLTGWSYTPRLLATKTTTTCWPGMMPTKHAASPKQCQCRWMMQQ